jgi:hypothetical protein
MANGSQSLEENHPTPPALRWAIGVVFSVAASAFVGLSLLFLYRLAGWEVLVAVLVFGAVLTAIGLAAGRLRSRREVRTAHGLAVEAEEAKAAPVTIEVREGSEVEVSAGTKVDISPEVSDITISYPSRWTPRSATWAVVGVGITLSIVALSVWAARSTSIDPSVVGAFGASLAIVPWLLRKFIRVRRDWSHQRAAASMFDQAARGRVEGIPAGAVVIHAPPKEADDQVTREHRVRMPDGAEVVIHGPASAPDDQVTRQHRVRMPDGTEVVIHGPASAPDDAALGSGVQAKDEDA